MRSKPLVLFFLGFVAVSMCATRAMAATYAVNRSFREGITTAMLSGTVAIPFGDYVLQSLSASPFTNVDLTLKVNATSYHLDRALTGIIGGTGRFLISADAANLEFNTTGGNGSNPADLVFSDTTNAENNNRYVIGSNGNPGFEAAYTNTGSAIADLSFPIVFGIAVPEPGGLSSLSLGMLGLFMRRRRAR
jgi:hypothetical protein